MVVFADADGVAAWAVAVVAVVAAVVAVVAAVVTAVAVRLASLAVADVPWAALAAMHPVRIAAAVTPARPVTLRARRAGCGRRRRGARRGWVGGGRTGCI